MLRLFRALIPRPGRVFSRVFTRFRRKGRYRRRYSIGVRAAAENWLQGIVLNWGDIDYLRSLSAEMLASPRGHQPFLRACAEILDNRVMELELQEEFNKLFKLFGF